MFNFCPKCGSDKKIKTEGSRFSCQSCGFVFYFNSKPTVSALIADKDKILLGKRRIEPSKGKWDIVGGFLEYGEHPEEGLRREVKEETGLVVEIEEFLGTFMDYYGKDREVTLNQGYIVKVISGEPSPADDIEELRWFSSQDIPKDIAFKNGKEMLNAWMARKERVV